MKLNADEALGGGVMLKVSERKSLNRESEQGRDKKENRRLSLSWESSISMEMMFEIVHGQSEHRALRNACKDREFLNIEVNFVCVLFWH